MASKPDLDRVLKLLRLAQKNPNANEGRASLRAAERTARGTPLADLIRKAREVSDPEPLIREAIERIAGSSTTDRPSRTSAPWRTPRRPRWEPTPSGKPAKPADKRPWAAMDWVEVNEGLWRGPSGIEVEKNPIMNATGFRFRKNNTTSRLFEKKEEAMIAAEDWLDCGGY